MSVRCDFIYLNKRVFRGQTDRERERFKMESTCTQQLKLIDFLQQKVETVPKKRRVCLWVLLHHVVEMGHCLSCYKSC